jgi:hypothetical protein
MPDTAPKSDGSLFHDLAEAQKWKRRAQDELAQAEALCKVLEPQAMERMQDAGISKVTANGITLYIHRQLWARPAAGEGEDTDAAYSRACAALRKAGLESYVSERFNVHSLSALFRERARDQHWNTPEDLLEPELRGTIAVTEDYQVRSRVAG